MGAGAGGGPAGDPGPDRAARSTGRRSRTRAGCGTRWAPRCRSGVPEAFTEPVKDPLGDLLGALRPHPRPVHLGRRPPPASGSAPRSPTAPCNGSPAAGRVVQGEFHPGGHRPGVVRRDGAAPAAPPLARRAAARAGAGAAGRAGRSSCRSGSTWAAHSAARHRRTGARRRAVAGRVGARVRAGEAGPAVPRRGLHARDAGRADRRGRGRLGRARAPCPARTAGSRSTWRTRAPLLLPPPHPLELSRAAPVGPDRALRRVRPVLPADRRPGAGHHAPRRRRDPQLADALWDLAWSGRLTNDTLAPLRALLGSGRTAGSTAHRAKRDVPRGRYGSPDRRRPRRLPHRPADRRRAAGRCCPAPEPDATRARARAGPHPARPARCGDPRRGAAPRASRAASRPSTGCCRRSRTAARRAAATSSRGWARPSSPWTAPWTGCARCPTPATGASGMAPEPTPQRATASRSRHFPGDGHAASDAFDPSARRLRPPEPSTATSPGRPRPGRRRTSPRPLRPGQPCRRPLRLRPRPGRPSRRSGPRLPARAAATAPAPGDTSADSPRGGPRRRRPRQRVRRRAALAGAADRRRTQAGPQGGLAGRPGRRRADPLHGARRQDPAGLARRPGRPATDDPRLRAAAEALAAAARAGSLGTVTVERINGTAALTSPLGTLLEARRLPRDPARPAPARLSPPHRAAEAGSSRSRRGTLDACPKETRSGRPRSACTTRSPGRVLTRSDLRVPRFATADLTGRTVLDVAPRGKHLLTRFEGGLTLHTHLRMEGAWQVYGPASAGAAAPATRSAPSWAPRPHGRRLPPAGAGTAAHRGGGPRRRPSGPRPARPGLGPGRAPLANLLADPARPLGEALLDQRNLAGIGNVYKCELCFLLGVTPWLPVGELPAAAPAQLPGVAQRCWRSTGPGRSARPPGLRSRARPRSSTAGPAAPACAAAPRSAWPTRATAPGPPTYWCPPCQTAPPQRRAPPSAGGSATRAPHADPAHRKPKAESRDSKTEPSAHPKQPPLTPPPPHPNEGPQHPLPHPHPPRCSAEPRATAPSARPPRPVPRPHSAPAAPPSPRPAEHHGPLQHAPRRPPGSAAAPPTTDTTPSPSPAPAPHYSPAPWTVTSSRKLEHRLPPAEGAPKGSPEPAPGRQPDHRFREPASSKRSRPGTSSGASRDLAVIWMNRSSVTGSASPVALDPLPHPADDRAEGGDHTRRPRPCP